MKQSEHVTELQKALIAARTDITNLYPSSSGYGYDYVPLEKIIDMLKTVLPKHGLGWVQLPSAGTDNTNIGLTTRVIHTSGEWIEDSVIIPATEVKGTNASQKLGASITYFRRYALCAVFGISGDKDVDANDKAFSQEPKKPSVPKEKLEEISTSLQGFLNNGILDDKPQWKKKAQYLLEHEDYDGMCACVDYCKGLEKK